MERTALSALGALLDRLGIRWVVIGALAANRYRAAPRLTQDVDLLLADRGPGQDALEHALRAAGWSVERAGREAELVRLRHPELADIEAILAAKVPLDEAYVERWARFWDVAAEWHRLRGDA